MRIGKIATLAAFAALATFAGYVKPAQAG